MSPGAWKLSKAVVECCIIVSALSGGFVYLLQGGLQYNTIDSLFLNIPSK